MFLQKLNSSASRARACLHSAIAPSGSLAESMRYATAGGKGIRAFLVLESSALHGVDPERAVWAAAAIEAVHAYSLVHDDLPCMDDDDLRRGLPTVHKKWNDATAVLCGDALQTLAYELLANEALGRASLPLITRMARASGQIGMIHGQALDIAAETAQTPLTLDEITTLQAGKTGALIEWSATAGAVIAGADDTPLSTYAHALGLAFQIADDILDIEGSESVTGKAVGKDADAGKATFVSHLGLDGAKKRAKELVETACTALSDYGDAADTLREAARFVIERDN